MNALDTEVERLLELPVRQHEGSNRRRAQNGVALDRGPILSEKLCRATIGDDPQSAKAPLPAI